MLQVRTLVIWISLATILTSILLSFLASVGPSFGMRTALLTITPSTALRSVQAESIDGPSVFIGLLGSCSRKSNSAPLMCAPTNLSPQYALSVLGNNLVNKALQPPPALLFVSTCFTIGVQFLFFILFIATAFAGRLGLKNRLERPRALAVTAGIGVLGSLGGAACFGILRLYFGKIGQDFNDMVQISGAQGPELIASIGGSFIMVWVSYPLLGIVVLLSSLKNHVKSDEGSESSDSGSMDFSPFPDNSSMKPSDEEFFGKSPF